MVKTIIVGTKEDNVYCETCGAKMKPLIMSHLIDYQCPNSKWYSWLLFQHLPIGFIRE